jgi:catechol 2,3-dioxygenase-like lactoylglutathione lyase family enzyme
MRINLTSVLVDDQEKALSFYTEKLGFVKKIDVPVGEHRWLTVVSPDDREGTELLLEPDGRPAAKPFKRALDVRFTQEPLELPTVTTAVFDDTCGNLIQIAGQG